MLTQLRLKELLHYCPEIGVFKRLVSLSNRVKIGDIAGNYMPLGYWQINVDGKRYFSHRLAWLYVYGEWPKNLVDHINGVKDDNRICNLREATASENLRNMRKHFDNKSGFKGVTWHKETSKWRAIILFKGKPKSLGLFATPELAHTAYCESAKELYGEFFRAN